MRFSLAVPVVVMLCCSAAAVPARADARFAPRYHATLPGGMTTAANSIATCQSDRYGPYTCRQAQRGAPAENYKFWMKFIDIDGDPATFDSSSARLNLPAGATPAYARLYWGGLLHAEADNPDLPAGNADAPDPASRGTVKFKGPGAAGYTDLTADVVQDATTSGLPFYQASADVTRAVRAAGGGTYTVGNIQAARGDGSHAGDGWTLVVAYRRAADPPRDVSVFDGLVNQAISAPPTVIRLSGFNTPHRGAVHAYLGLVAYEGDAGPYAAGDGATLATATRTLALRNALNPVDNIFNSTITEFGRQWLTRDPAHLNTLGYDSDVFDISKVLGNGDRSLTVRLSTDGDAFLPGVALTQIDLNSPRIELTKSVSGGTARIGSTLTYEVRATNTGTGSAENVTIADPIPAHTAYVRGSLSSGTYSGGRITVRPGGIPPGATFTFRFKVRVTGGSLIQNASTAAYHGRDVPGTTLSANSNRTRTPVLRTARRPPPTHSSRPPRPMCRYHPAPEPADRRGCRVDAGVPSLHQ